MGDRENEDMGWDSLVLLNQREKLGASSSMASHCDFSPAYPLLMENQSPYHLVPFLSGSDLPCDRNARISELVGSFALPESAQISNPGCSSFCPINKNSVRHERPEDHSLSKQAAGETYPHLKRRRQTLNPQSSADKGEISDEKRHKPVGKGAKENSLTGDTTTLKEDFIHVRARSGQATNSHSLAERVRREKISERMRLLQELVPGCNKITGKAVMLDEIINYVQSLQQQVEFLSMKLSTVDPELNIDLERIQSKDIMHRRIANVAIPGFGSGLTSSESIQGNFTGMAAPFPQAALHNELRSILEVGFNYSSGFENLG